MITPLLRNQGPKSNTAFVDFLSDDMDSVKKENNRMSGGLIVSLSQYVRLLQRSDQRLTTEHCTWEGNDKTISQRSQVVTTEPTAYLAIRKSLSSTVTLFIIEGSADCEPQEGFLKSF